MNAREENARELFAFLTQQQYDELWKDKPLSLDPREVYTKCLTLVDYTSINKVDVQRIFEGWRDKF